MNRILVHPCGVEITLKRAEYAGVITAVSIRQGCITYEVGYFCDGGYKTNWFLDCEFTVLHGVKKRSIGFHNV